MCKLCIKTCFHYVSILLFFVISNYVNLQTDSENTKCPNNYLSLRINSKQCHQAYSQLSSSNPLFLGHLSVTASHLSHIKSGLA